MEPGHEIPPLRPYQEEAIEQALVRGNQLLALVMGSGKSRIAIETVEALAEDGFVTAGCIFCPTTLKYQWRDAELGKWGDPSNALVIDGDKKKRTQQYKTAEDYRYTILNYEALVHDWDLIKEYLPIDFMVLDEITYIKSFKAKRSRRMKAMAKHCEFRFGLSGQPVENRPEELFSIMEFIDPDVLGSFHKFDRTFILRDHFGRPKKYRNLPTLHKKMHGSMFRRSREDIAEFLPKRIETDIPVRLDPKVQRLYTYIAEDCLAVIEQAGREGHGGFDLMAHYGQGDEESNRLKGEIMARMTAMRLLCSHPDLLEQSADNFDDPELASGSKYASGLKEAGTLGPLRGAKSAKLEALMAQIDEIFAESPDNKVVIFSGFKPMLRIIGQELRERKIGYTTIDGDTPHKVREDRKNRFNNSEHCRVFLSSDAGAYGVNLDQGSHLFSFDLPWSAGVLAQRVARIDRTSSVHSSINIGYLFSANTIEEHQYGLLKQKAKVAEAFVDKKHVDAAGAMILTLESLKEFLEGIVSNPQLSSSR